MMHVVPWDIRALRQEVDRVVRSFLEEEGPIHPLRGELLLPLDVEETEDKVIVKAEIPGVDPKDVQVTIARNLLTLKGEKRQEKDEKKTYHRTERHYGVFQRSVRLPADIDSEKAKAEYNNGILEITLPKVEDAKGKEIKIEIK